MPASRPAKKAVVLLSGGLDSAVALWWAKERGWRCHGLTFHYGQRHDREVRSARRVAAEARIPLEEVTFSLPWAGGSSLVGRKRALPSRRLETMAAGIPSTYVPGRNTIFLSFAMSFADAIGATALVIGANAVDYSGYPDCRAPYLRAFERVATLGSRLGTEGGKRIAVLSPLVRLTKAGIVRLGRRLGAPLEKTWSCYAGGARPCGRCDSCRIREKGFREAEEL
jgi:7-cyano-7-deazaguanine synthase